VGDPLGGQERNTCIAQGMIDRIYLPKKVTEDGGYTKESQQDYSQGQS
jgi:hypothetical protein